MTDTFAPILAANIVRFRNQREMSQHDLAAALALVGCPKTQTWVSRAERDTLNPTINDVVHLALALGVSLPALITPPEDNDNTRQLWNWLNSTAPLQEHTDEQARVWRAGLRP